MKKKGTQKERDLRVFSFAFEKGMEAGAEKERKEWIDSVPRGMVLFTFRARSEDDKVDNIRSTLTFKQIVAAQGHITDEIIRDLWYKLARDGVVIKTLLPTSPTEGEIKK